MAPSALWELGLRSWGDVGRWLELRDEAAGQRAGPLGLIFAKEMSCQDVNQGQCLIRSRTWKNSPWLLK